MQTVADSRFRMFMAASAVFVAALLTGAAFAGWLNHSADIFLAYTASGLAWCF
ncbi:MAG: hypothetical protein AAF724_22315 [Pseudomonadota bacterium]